MELHDHPSVGDTVAAEIGPALQRVWTVTRVSPQGRQATIRSEATEEHPEPLTRQIYRRARGGNWITWRFGTALVRFTTAPAPQVDDATASKPVITIDITDRGSALGYVRDLPEDQDWSIYGNRDEYRGHWTVWTDRHGRVTRSTLPAALRAWAKQYGIPHGRATGWNEVRGGKIDISW